MAISESDSKPERDFSLSCEPKGHELVVCQVALGLGAMNIRARHGDHGVQESAVFVHYALRSVVLARIVRHQIDPGVPWTMTLDKPPLHLALKAGKFGDEDFFTRAFHVLK